MNKVEAGETNYSTDTTDSLQGLVSGYGAKIKSAFEKNRPFFKKAVDRLLNTNQNTGEQQNGSVSGSESDDIKDGIGKSFSQRA